MSPEILPNRTSIVLKTGSTLNLTCVMNCTTSINFDWIETFNSGESLVISSGPTLFIEELLYEHSGSFHCQARVAGTNGQSYGEYVASEPVSVSVVGPPYIDTDLDLDNVTVHVGDDLDVEVYYCSRPAASVSWVVSMEDNANNKMLLLSGRKHGRFSTQTKW